jgi:uncharacterized alpha/beta hydrolase family protein
MSFEPANISIKYITADRYNITPLKITVYDKNGSGKSSIPVRVYIKSGFGSIGFSDSVTDSYGQSLVNYVPQDLYQNGIDSNRNSVEIIASVKGTSLSKSMKFNILPLPLVLIHGYQENTDVFKSMEEYLKNAGFLVSSFNYNSKSGVINGSNTLKNHLEEMQIKYSSLGIGVKRFDSISHSMGGLVLRYYTTNSEYLSRGNIRKTVFLSVPNKGSPWASLGANYIDDAGVRDLTPDGALISKTLHSFFNKGLNPNIETYNLLAQYDEVVDTQSASLEEWGIKTALINVGSKSTIIDSFLKGNILDAPNHKNILLNNKVFEEIKTKLNSKLPYPNRID